MFLTLTQIMLFVLIIYLVWNAIFKPAGAAAPKPADPAKPGEAKPGGGGKRRPREYLGWLGGFILFLSVLLAFISPNNPAIAEVWSILSLPLKPLGLAILLMLFAVGDGIRNGGITKDAEKQIRVAFTILLIFSIPLIAYMLVQLTEADSLSALRASAHRREKVGAIVLLGQATTQVTFLEVNQIHLTDAGDRIIQTAREYKQQINLGSYPLVVVSAGPRPGLKADPNRNNTIEAQDITRILVSLGVLRDDIIIEPTGLDIRTSALAVKKLVDKGVIGKRVILVSSALNMQRARQSFSLLGIQTIPSPSSFYTFGSGAIPSVRFRSTQKGTCDALTVTIRNARDIQFSDFMPSVEALLLSTRVINEFWSSVYYFLRGWLANGVDAAPPAKDVGC